MRSILSLPASDAARHIRNGLLGTSKGSTGRLTETAKYATMSVHKCNGSLDRHIGSDRIDPVLLTPLTRTKSLLAHRHSEARRRGTSASAGTLLPFLKSLS